MDTIIRCECGAELKIIGAESMFGEGVAFRVAVCPNCTEKAIQCECDTCEFMHGNEKA